MDVLDLQFIQRPLSASMLMGDQGSQRTLQALNQLCNVTASTVYSDAGLAHMNMVQTSINNIVSKLVTANDILRSVTDFRPITQPDQLCYIPNPMQIPILCMPEIRELHKAGKIFGFGIPVNAVPEEDIYGRLINNGKVEVTSLKDNPEDVYQTWEWRTDDPELSFSDLDNIESTRIFLREFLAEQMKAGGDQLDPTDYPNQMNVKIK